MNFGSKLTKVNESTRLESTGPKKLIIDYLHSLERKKSIKMKEKIKLSRQQDSGKDIVQNVNKIKIQEPNNEKILQNCVQQQLTPSQNKVLSQDIINHLGEFIEYFIQNQQMKKRKNKILQEEMKASPLQALQDIVKKKRLILKQAREQHLKENMEVQFAVKKIEEQQTQTSIYFLQIQRNMEKLKEKHKEQNILGQRINQLISIIEEEEKRINANQEQIRLQWVSSKQDIEKQAEEFKQQMKKMRDQIRWIENMKQSIESKKQMLKLESQVLLSFQFHLQQTIKQKSQKDVKFDILNSASVDSNISNKDLLQQTYGRIERKIEYFKKGIQAHNQKSKFLNFLSLVESQDKGQMKVTKASHELVDDQKNFLEDFSCQYKVYSQYLAVDQTIKKLREILQNVEQKHKQKIGKIREQIQNIKERNLMAANLQNQMENTFKIRQAQIKQLQSIVEEQNSKLAKFRQASSDNSLYIFSSSLSGLKKKTSLFGQ